LHVTVFTSGGSNSKISARMYGYKGTSPAAAARTPAGSGTFTALTGDATSTATGGATSVVKINGGSVPASAHVLGTNGSSQPIVSTATDLSSLNYVAGGGIAQVQTVTLSPAVTALTNGLQVCWLPVAANTAAAPTLAVNATAAKPITKLGTTALVANDLTTTAVACAIYDGTEYQLQNPQTVSSGGPFVPYTGATGDVALGIHGITGAAFTGDSGSGGTTGLVPAPAAGDAAAGKYLAAGGGYGVPPGTGGAANYQTVDNAGTPLTQRPTLNFTGSGVSCADNSGATRTDCTITGGGGSGTGSTVFSSTTTAGPNNSAAETSVIGTVTGSNTIAANTFTNGAVLQAHAQGYFSFPALADSLTLKMKCGSTVIGSAVFVAGSSVLTNGSWRFWLDITARGTGTGGAFITNGLAELTSGSAIDSTAQVLNTTTVAYDFTTACVFDVTAQWGAAQVGETIQGTNVAAWFPGGGGGGGGGTPPYIRQAFASATNAATLTPTLNVVAGNWLAIEVGFNSGPVSSITDGTNTYQVIKTDTHSGNSCYLALTQNSVNGPITITANGSLTYANMEGIEFVAPTLVGTVDASGSNVSSNQYTGVPLTTTGTNDVIIQAISYNHNYAGVWLSLLGTINIAISGTDQDSGAIAFYVVPQPDTYLSGIIDSIGNTNTDAAVCAGAIK
jgi:hypothetical protein